MSRFEEVDQGTQDMLDDLIKNDFPILLNARIKALFNTKAKKSKGTLVFGQMVKATPILNYLTGDDQGYNYVMFLDGNVFPAIDTEDQKRIIRHELNHINIDLDAKDPYKIVNHEVEDFHKEIEYNKEDPRWLERVSEIASQIYSKD